MVFLNGAQRPLREIRAPFVCPLGLLEDLVTLSLDFMLVFVSVRFQDMALSFHTLEQKVETKYWYWNGYLLQVLQILLRDDVVARARITASEVCSVLFAVFGDRLVSYPYCKLSCSYLSSLLLHFQQKWVVILFTHQVFHIM
jgi:hypothetical protein